jgi:hypothetical protein
MSTVFKVAPFSQKLHGVILPGQCNEMDSSKKFVVRRCQKLKFLHTLKLLKMKNSTYFERLLDVFSLRINFSSAFRLLVTLASFYPLTSCENEDAVTVKFPATKSPESVETMASNSSVGTLYSNLPSGTEWELQQARASTARYRNIHNAVKDGYSDIDVVVQNMGHHYMKSTNVDAIFDFRNPEILVYNKFDDGTFELVAVEYAIPISMSVSAPEGFTGEGDEWDHNDGFGLWLLHAWVWTYNPDGVFNPTNTLVHLH